MEYYCLVHSFQLYFERSKHKRNSYTQVIPIFPQLIHKQTLLYSTLRLFYRRTPLDQVTGNKIQNLLVFGFASPGGMYRITEKDMYGPVRMKRTELFNPFSRPPEIGAQSHGNYRNIGFESQFDSQAVEPPG